MRKRKRYLINSSGPFNLDSLVDIISNNVGILVILAVFMAMYSLLEKSDTKPEKKKKLESVKKIKIPWSHSSQKNKILFLLRDNRFLFFDRSLVYQNLKKYLSGSNTLPKQISLNQYSIKLTTGVGHIHCLEFLTTPGTGEWFHQLSKKGGLLQSLTKKYPPEENYFFFWVDPNSFDIFHQVRESLWRQRFEVGWEPIRKESVLRTCSGIGREKNFQPQ